MTTPKPESDDGIEKTFSKESGKHGGLRFRRVEDLGNTDGAVVAKSAAFVAATTVGKTSYRSRASYVLYAAFFVSFLCSCANGYDGSLMNAINGMTPYQNKFHSGRLGSTTSIIFSIYNIGNLVGAFFAAAITDRHGRRWAMFIGSFIIIIGSIVITSSEKQGQFIAGRFILGFGVAIVTTGAPSYCVEIAPPAWRGRATGFYNCGWFGGSIPAAAITLGTSYMTSDWGWRLPLLLQCVPAICVCCSVFFFPESPRWLMAQGRDEEARAFLVKYHGNGDPKSPIVDIEFEEFKEDIKIDASDKRWWDFAALVNSHSARWRTAMMVFMGVAGQFSGNGLGYFNLSIYEAAGYGYVMQFVLNLLNSICSAIAALMGVAIADRCPRRPLLIWGSLASAAMLAANAGLTIAWGHRNVEHPNMALGRGAIAAYFLFNIFFSFAYTPLQALYPSECIQTNTRAKGMAAYAFTVSAVGFINTYAGPIGLQNITTNYVFVFVGWDCVEAVLWYFFCVETQGRTLEELSEIFEDPNPVAASKRARRVVVTEDAVLVEK